MNSLTFDSSWWKIMKHPPPNPLEAGLMAPKRKRISDEDLLRCYERNTALLNLKKFNLLVNFILP
jgi:hypothetical protein